MNSRRRQRGYSLAEMLTVVAIVGTLTLVTVPAFMSYRQSAKMKVSMRNFTSDLRTARSLAISRAHEVKLSYPTGTNARIYNYSEGDRGYGTVNTWTPVTGAGSKPPKPQRELDPIVYFPADSVTTPQTFVDEDSTADGLLDVIFYPDGSVKLPKGATKGTISLKTDRRIYRPQYTIEISPTGRVLAQ